MNQAWLGLGSNLGDRLLNLDQAKLKLIEADSLVLEQSRIIETKAYGKTDQPDFLNCVLKVSTELNAEDLLALCLRIEDELGRVREEKWGPRIIDLDILFFNSEIIDQQNLRVPHPDLQNRMFVLESLKEISPELIHPVLNKSVSDLYNILLER